VAALIHQRSLKNDVNFLFLLLAILLCNNAVSEEKKQIVLFTRCAVCHKRIERGARFRPHLNLPPDWHRAFNRSRAIVITVLMLLVATPVISQTPRQARFWIEVFKYDGSGEPDKPVNILTIRFEQLKQEVASDYPRLSLKLKNLKVVPQSSNYPSGEFELWSHPPVLEVLGGTLYAKSGTSTTMESLVYLGGLQGSLKRNPISLIFDVQPNDFDNFKGLHGVLTLYALAMDAKACGEPRNIINDLLSEAKGLLPASAAHANETEQELLEAVEKEEALNRR
jgi:hypothetical protein